MNPEEIYNECLEESGMLSKEEQLETAVRAMKMYAHQEMLELLRWVDDPGSTPKDLLSQYLEYK